MQDVSAAWLAAAQADHAQPVLYVELLACGLAYATRAVPGAHVWRVDDGAYVDQTIRVDEARGPFATTLAPFDEALGRLQASLDDRTNSARVGGTTVTLLNAGRLSNIMDTVTLDNTPIQISLGFQGLAPHHNVILFRGVIDDVEWNLDRLTLSVTDDALRVHRDLSTPVGARYFPATPRVHRGRAIPICIGRQTDIEAYLVAGDATGTLAVPLDDVNDALLLAEFDAPFPATGTLSIGSETGITYAACDVVTIAGVNFLRLGDLTRGAPTTHNAGAAVTLDSPTYQALVGYQVGAVSQVRDTGIVVSASAYSVTLADAADAPVTLLTLDAAPSGTLTVDAEGANVTSAGAITNGDFETGDTTGWDVTDASVNVTTDDTLVGDYKAEVTGDTENVWGTMQQTFATTIGQGYTLRFAAQIPQPSDTGELLNGTFSSGLTNWTANAPAGTLPSDVTTARQTIYRETGAGYTVRQARAVRTQNIVSDPDYVPSVSGDTVDQSWYQDITTTVSATYSLRLRYSSSHTRPSGAFLYEDASTAGYQIGTTAAPDAIADVLFDPPSLGTNGVQWHDVAVTFVATDTTTRITLRSRAERLAMSGEVYVYFGLRDGAAPQSAESYQGVTYATPETTTHPDEPLSALCNAAHTLYRRTRRLDVFADMIRDLDTANKLLEHKVVQHTIRHDDVTLTTGLDAAPVQVVDLVHVIHPWLHAGQPQLCQLRARALRGTDVTLTLRTIQQAGLYEDWEPPALPTFAVAVSETWGPDAADLFGTPVDPGVWLIADDLTGTLSDADPVAAWPERVSGADVTPGSAGLQPTYRAGVLNGHAVVRFDGANDYLDGGTRLDAIAGDSGYTFVVVCTNVGASTGSPFGYGCFFARDASGNRGMSFNYHNGTKFLRAYVPTSPSVTPTLRIGNDGWGDVLKGDIAELLYYRRALTDDELLSLYNYLSDKYGV